MLIFAKEKSNRSRKVNGSKLRKCRINWTIDLLNPKGEIKAKLAQTSFKHIVLSEQAVFNWDYLYQTIKRCPVKILRSSNLLPYGSRIQAAKGAGVMAHLDSVKQVVTWSRIIWSLPEREGIVDGG